MTDTPAEKPDLKLWNTLTRKKETFAPIDPKNVRMYVCGPTVYDFAHIGNARPVIVFDVLYRLLRHIYGERNVTYVRNITDVDDKINARALRDFGTEIQASAMSLNDAIRNVTETTANQFQQDVEALGCLTPTAQPRATEHIDGIVRMAQGLIDKGHAYVAQGQEGREVLFNVASMPDYGRLSNRKLEDQQAGARIAVKDHKRNPGDFVLWKESAAHEPGWPAHFHSGAEHIDIFGRPGWHIECSVMSEAHLGKEFDIHGGGLDLIFPHHENEIAQSRCAHGTNVMAKYWMHNGFLQLEGKKMSKSDGNFVTINELLNTTKFGGRRWQGAVLRLAMLMTHYREPIDFSVKRLEEAEAKLQRWADALFQHRDKTKPLEIRFVGQSLLDDLNTVGFIAELDSLAKEAKRGSTNAASVLFAALTFIGLPDIDAYAHTIANSGAVILGSNIGIDQAVQQRLAHLSAKNFAEADRIRNELSAQGIQLMDYKDPETGERKTKWEVKR
jgi:cysteinyl-tRNA synthetase